MNRSVQSVMLLATLLCTAASAGAEHSPYSGLESSDVKALTAEEQSALLDGKGMGFAKAAELNGYPGPRHVLDLAEQLELSASQVGKTRVLFERMQATARADGVKLVAAEHRLDRLYATRTATAQNVGRQLARIEAIRTHLRGVHLNAHLEQAALLTPPQIARYAQLRGYDSHAPAPQHPHHH